MTLKERLIPIEEIEYLCVWAWKRRTGWIGGVAANLSSKFKGRISKWENRSVVVCGTALSYYETGDEDGTPRGKIDIVEDNASFQICKPEHDAPSQHQVVITTDPPPPSPAHNPGDDEMEPAKQPVEWKFCFIEQQDLMRFVEILNRILDHAGKFKQQDTSRFEHQFQAGDHIYRWEMIVCPPVIYPIQIHGIVLEAGSNCLIVADFGLTGYSRKKGKDFNHTSDEDHHNNAVIMAAFRKIRPNDVTQRLHIVTLTDPKEIRKWIKAGYDEESMLAKAKAAGGGNHHFGSLSKVFSRNKSKKKLKKDIKGDDETADGTENPTSPSSRRRSSKDTMKSVTKAFKTTLPWTSSAEEEKDETMSQEGQSEKDNEDCDLPTVDVTTSTEEDDNTASNSTSTVPMNNTTSPKEETNKKEEQDDDDDASSSSKRVTKDKQQQLSNELPHSDPKEIVLARANFVLEHMEVLPPYHVFFSNSECIAVWCKTGHWCTLQTAVWCGTNSVAAAKTSTLTAIGVAAANPLLAPVVAVGGLVWVSAPMVILQKSRVKWEEATKKMTELFWEWAPPIVFVSAIENWAGMSLTTNAEDEEEDETTNNDDDDEIDVTEGNDDENLKSNEQEEQTDVVGDCHDGQVVKKEEQTEREIKDEDVTIVAGDDDDDDAIDVKEVNDDENLKNNEQEEQNDQVVKKEEQKDRENKDEDGQKVAIVAGGGGDGDGDGDDDDDDNADKINGVAQAQNGSLSEENGEVSRTPTVMSI